MTKQTDTQMSDSTWNNFKSAAKDAYADGKGETVQSQNGQTIIFTLPEQIGCLADALVMFKNRNVNLTHIESRISKTERGSFEFYVNVEENETAPKDISLLLEDLKKFAKNVTYDHEEALWFPSKISDLDRLSNRVLSNASELDTDHPGYSDPNYRARRKELAALAMEYKHGEPLPKIKYTQEEINTWDTVLSAVLKLHPTHACKEFLKIFPSCGYKLGTIPQFDEMSNFLKVRTGFTLRPVAGLLSARDFLCGLAFRVFFATPYVRHSKTPMWTPEPDVVREFIGHVPLLADPVFAQFVQELGLLSLGAPEEWIKRISRIYWFTLEFGMIHQNGNLKAYGASLLASFGELQHCISDKPIHHSFEPEKTSQTSYPIEEYQPQYFVFESFAKATKKVKQWATAIPKPQSIRYNAFTEGIETLEDKERIMNLIREMKCDMDRVEDAIQKVH